MYLGPKLTPSIIGSIYFEAGAETLCYKFELEPTADNRLVFRKDVVAYTGSLGESSRPLGSGHQESRLTDEEATDGPVGTRLLSKHVRDFLAACVVYHFHDTSETAGVRRQNAVNDDKRLRPDAGNLASFLYRIQPSRPSLYTKIRDVVRLAAPFFDDFDLRPVSDKPDLIQLEWLQVGSDYPFRANHLSDGTLRFICLATALLQPTPPSTMLFDEPELGLHPYALSLLAGLFKQAASRTQVIVSTQSALLLNAFEPEDVIVVERAEGQSSFRRLESAQLSEWLEDYALGELWQKNVLGGRPSREDAPEPSRKA